MTTPRSGAQVERSLLDGVLAVMRELGGSSSLAETLDLIAHGIVDVLGFGAAAVNVATPEGELRVAAVAGPAGVEELLGTSRPLAFWTRLLEEAEPWGELRFFGHDRDQSLVDQFVTWTPAGPVSTEPDAWHPDDSLMAPLWDGDRLIGVLGVDQPATGRRPDRDQCTVLEAFASQAAKAIRDAQERQQADADRLDVEHRWQLAFEYSPTGVALVAPDGSISQVNDALVGMLGYSRDQLLQMKFGELTHPDDVQVDGELFAELLAGSRDSYQMEKRYQRADGGVVSGLLHVGVIRDDDELVRTVVVQVIDITERKRAAGRLAYQLTHDQLTGLPNRAQLAEELSMQLVAGRPAGVLFCDIDRFKTINDSLGRQAGDELLRAAARRLGELLPDGYRLGRVSADQFVVLAPDHGGVAALREFGETLTRALSRPLSVAGLQLSLGMSVGAAASAAWHQRGEEVMREAEQALTRAKQQGRGRVEVYDPHQDHSFTLDDLRLEQALRAAVGTGDGLQLYLQPIVNVPDETPVGAESLIRWQHPTRGVLQPAQFLPLAERSGLIVALGWRMLELSARAAARSRAGAQGWVAVNVAASQLGRGQLPAAVQAALATQQLPPHRLHLEITETALVEASAQAIGEVREVADMGISIALDDFGTGYSSLSLLRDLPISVVKIDRSFIAPIAEDRRAAALVRSLVVMCDSLGISTVAEGVETREQLALVSALGCDHAQGYLFGPADPADIDTT